MKKEISKPITFLNHPGQWQLRSLLEQLFISPDPDRITAQVVDFLHSHPLPADDFPLISGTYTRTILLRNNNGFEAMAAHWSPGTVSSIHGHPFFTLYYVVTGQLAYDNFRKNNAVVEKTSSGRLSASEHIAFIGRPDTFDNHIHQVTAMEETLSIHVSSDDATKGEIFFPERTVQ